MTTDEGILLATSIGACLAAIAAFCAVWEASKQRKASYHPELVISRTFFESSSTEGFATDWKRRGQVKDDTSLPRRFAVPFVNVGLGAAIGVEVHWGFDIEALVSEINSLSQELLLPALFEFEDGVLRFESEALGRTLCMWRNQQNKDIDFVLPALVGQQTTDLVLPLAYTQLISALVYFGVRAEQLAPLEELPPLRVEFRYSDIGGKSYISNLKLSANIGVITNEGSSFKGSIESAIDA